jgi:hypothetical protein
MKFINSIYNFLKGLNKNTIIFILGALFVLLFLKQCNDKTNLKTELNQVKIEAERAHNNYVAAQDTIKYYRAENGGLIAEKRAFVFTQEEFEKNYKDLKSEYVDALNLGKNLSKQNVLLKSQIEILSTIKPAGTVAQLNDSSAFINFTKFDDFGMGNSRTFTGKAKILYFDKKFLLDSTQTQFDIKQNIKLYASIDESNGYKQVKMASSYPGLNVLDIENINLINNKLNEAPKKRDRWVMGVGVGYGVSLVNGSTLSLSPWIGASLLWTPKWLQFGK